MKPEQKELRLARSVLLWCLAAPLGPAWAVSSITGTITLTAGGGTVASEVVLLLSNAGGKGWAVVQSTTTNFSGFYSFTTGAGDYIVKTDKITVLPGNCSNLHSVEYYDVAAPNAAGRVESAADVITVGDSSTVTGIDISVEIVGALEARVTQGGSGLGGAQVRVENISNWLSHRDTVTYSAPPASAGLFTACGVDPGQHRLWIHHPGALYEDLLLPGPYVVLSNMKTVLGDLPMTPIAADPHEPNPSPASGTTLPSPFYDWESSGAIVTPLGGDVDFYCFDALADDRFFITTTTGLTVAGEPRPSPWVDPMLGWFSTSPEQLLLSNDDDPSGAGPFNARLDTGVVAETGTYCVGVTTYGDPDFNGSGQLSAGRYGLRIVSRTVFADGFESGDTSSWSDSVP